MLRNRLRQRSIHLILDWDGTLTKSDTLHFLGRISAQHRQKNAHPAVTPSNWNGARDEAWQGIVQAYINDFDEHQKEYRLKQQDRRTLEQERHWLKSLEGVENRSVQRVEDAELFKGVTFHEVEDVARGAVQSGELQLRSGWDELFSRLQDDKTNAISILSVNWSRSFIRGCLLHASTSSRLREAVQRMEIDANEIEGLTKPDGSCGKLSKDGEGGIRTSSDKLRFMPTPAKEASSEESPMVVYVGDSTTDLECLLAADIGICVRDTPTTGGQQQLIETLDRVGVAVKPVEQIKISESTPVSKTLWWARDFDEIAAAIAQD